MKGNRFRASVLSYKRRQSGSVLIIGILLLLMMTLLGLITTTETRTDSRITGNNLDRAIAFQAAEAALREAESKLNDPSNSLDSDDGFYGETETPPADVSTWTDNNSYEATVEIPGVAEQPRYIIDRLSSSELLHGYVVVGEVYHSRDKNIYRITVVCTGRSGTTQVVLQTTFVPPAT